VSSPRRYRERPSHPIPVWNGLLAHRPRVGAAIWAFLWCLDGITQETDGVGLVHGGAPVKIPVIAAALQINESTARRDLKHLDREGYVRLRRTPYGLVIEVCNSCKFGIWSGHKRSGENARTGGERSGKSDGQIGQKCPERSGENARNKEDAARNAARRQQQPAAPLTSNPEVSVWGFLKISPCGPISFRTLLENRWASRNGDRPSVLIGETVDAWEAAEGQKLRRTPQLFRALAGLRQKEQASREQAPGGHARPIRVLTAEEIPA
jgi:hypothetical protein